MVFLWFSYGLMVYGNALSSPIPPDDLKIKAAGLRQKPAMFDDTGGYPHSCWLWWYTYPSEKYESQLVWLFINHY